MGVVGPSFVGGTGALAFLLAAEVVAATAVVSEAALVYVARHRNLIISAFMVAVQAALSVAFIEAMRDRGWPIAYQAAGPPVALMRARPASILKATSPPPSAGAGLACPLIGAGGRDLVGWLSPLCLAI